MGEPPAVVFEDGRTCPFLFCLVAEPHSHPSCPACGSVRYGNFMCPTCRELRGDDLNPHTILPKELTA